MGIVNEYKTKYKVGDIIKGCDPNGESADFLIRDILFSTQRNDWVYLFDVIVNGEVGCLLENAITVDSIEVEASDVDNTSE